MAEATLNDVTKGLQQVTESIRQQTLEAGQPDPVKFVKEEIVAILAQRSHAKQDIAIQTKAVKTADDAEKVDQDYYDKQLVEQEHTSEEIIKSGTYLSKIADSIPVAEEATKQMVLMLTDQRSKTQKFTDYFRVKFDGLTQTVKDTFNVKKQLENIANFGKGLIEQGRDQFNFGKQFEAKKAEARSKEKSKGKKDSTFFSKIADGITGIAKSAKDKVKSGLSGFSKFAFGALAVAALAFLNSPYFEQIKNQILDVIIPALAYIYDEIIKPLAIYIGTNLLNLFKDLKSYIDGEKGMGDVIWDNLGIISLIVAALAPNLLFGALYTAVKGIGTALLWASAKTGLTALITAKLVAVKTFFTATFFPFLKALLVPIKFIAIKVGAIVLAIYSFYKAIVDAYNEFVATGSIWEAVKTFLVSFVANFAGFIFNLLKDAVSWGIEFLGDLFGIDTSAITKALDDFDFIDFFKESLTTMGNFLSGLFDAAINFLKEKGRKILKFVGLDSISDSLFGTKAQDEAKKKAKEEEQRQFALARKALKEKKRLAKLEEERIEKENKLKRERVARDQELLGREKFNISMGFSKDRDAAMARAVASRPKVPLFERLGKPREIQAPAPSIFNAPTTVSAPRTTNVTSTETSLNNNDRVIDTLSFVT